MANIRDTQCGKMSNQPCRQTTEKISGRLSRASAKSKTARFLFLNLRNGKTPAWSSETDSLSAIGLSTADISESPKGEEESILSAILQETVDSRYLLSAVACRGILQRASKRGKALPVLLKKALEQQKHNFNAPSTGTSSACCYGIGGLLHRTLRKCSRRFEPELYLRH